MVSTMCLLHLAQSTPVLRVETVVAKLFDCGRKCAPDRFPGAKDVNLLVTKHTIMVESGGVLQESVWCLRL